MVNHPNRGNPGLTHSEARSLFSALEGLDPAFFEDVAPEYEARVKSALAKLDALPARSVLLPFSRKELELLWHALGNGAGDDAMHNLGLRPDEKRTLAAACNRIADAGKLGGPRF